METKKYTNHSSFFGYITTFIIIASWLSLDLFTKDITNSLLLIIVFSLGLVYYLVNIIKCGLAWHSYMETSYEGVKMKGCAKRVSEDKTETIDDLFIPWKEIDEIKGWLGYLELVLKTGKKITLTQPINVDRQTVQKAFEQYKSIQRQKEQEQLKSEAEQLKDKIVSVISEADNNEV